MLRLREIGLLRLFEEFLVLNEENTGNLLAKYDVSLFRLIPALRKSDYQVEYEEVHIQSVNLYEEERQIMEAEHLHLVQLIFLCPFPTIHLFNSFVQHDSCDTKN